MSWMTKLYDTYESISQDTALNKDLEPIYHKKEQCHVEIIIDSNGKFIRAQPLLIEVTYGKKKFWKGEDTIIPVTPESLTGRTSGAAPYPLTDQIQYVAKDYPDYGGTKKSYFDEYFKLLNSWATSDQYSHFKVAAVAKYVSTGHVVRDLINAGILFAYKENRNTVLINKWAKQGPVEPKGKKKAPKPPLLNAVNGNEQGNAKIRWRVQRVGDPNDLTWNDQELVSKWQSFQHKKNAKNGFCQVLGKEKFIFNKHPKGIIPKANDAKLISSPTDKSYLTYQGKFTNIEEPCGLSFEVSQKAHNILRWLIGHQGYSNNEQVYITWAVSGKAIPEPLADSWSMLCDDIVLQAENEETIQNQIDHSFDLGQHFAHQFNKYISGYRTKLEPNEQIMVMGLDSATTGRMGVIYYRELLASEFLNRIHEWHSQFAWPQRHFREYPNPDNKKKANKTTIWPVSTPVPRVIAEAAYGNVLKSNDTLKKSLMERILPCIVDGCPFPRDVMLAAVHRTCNRNIKRLSQQYSNSKSENAEWEKHLGVACALFKGFYMRHPDKTKRREYAMALEEEKNSRDYLYGRLLAIAEYIEEIALNVGGESRPTTAARMMQRFADYPYTSWRNIELGLQPYIQRLQGTRSGFLANRKKELDAVLCAFDSNDYTSNKPLSGEFLLGYHCQKQYWRNNKSDNTNNQTNKENSHESGK